MGLQMRLTKAPDGAGGGRAVARQKLVPTITREPKIFFEYTPEPKDQGTKIVFIQTVQDWLDGRLVKPSELNAGLDFKDADTTGRGWCVDYFTGEKDPYYNGDDDPDVLDIGPKFGGQQGNALAKPVVTSKMNDGPNYDDSWFPRGKSKTAWQFVTAAFSAAGADAVAYYAYQAWTFEKEKGKAPKITKGLAGADPGQDFKDAVNLWCGNHPPFKLPAPKPPPPPPPPKPGVKTYVVNPGDTLQTIARTLYGREDLWPTIYFLNVMSIGPIAFVALPPGLVLALP